MQYKILVVDDQKDERDVTRLFLKADGFSVIAAENAEEALLMAVESQPDLILSDVSMPETDGIVLCQTLKRDRRTAHIPVILISALRKQEEEQLEGMEEGADDYLPKPASPRLLVAKIKTVLRRYRAPAELGEVLKAEGLSLDILGRTVTMHGKKVSLTRIEFDLLALLLRKRGRVLSIPYLLETVWGYDPRTYNNPRTVETHISRLKQKLGGKLDKKLLNVRGLGYQLQT